MRSNNTVRPHIVLIAIIATILVIATVQITKASYPGANCYSGASNDLGQTYAQAIITGSSPLTSSGTAYVIGDTWSPPCPMDLGRYTIASQAWGIIVDRVVTDSHYEYGINIPYAGGWVSASAYACGRSVGSTAIAYLTGQCGC